MHFVYTVLAIYYIVFEDMIIVLP